MLQKNTKEAEMLYTQIKDETEHYYLAITRGKDLTLARKIKDKIQNLHKMLVAIAPTQPMGRY